MTDGDHHTHRALAAQLTETIHRLRQDVESRSDPVLEGIADALELTLGLTTHAHDHALENRERIAALEQGRRAPSS